MLYANFVFQKMFYTFEKKRKIHFCFTFTKRVIPSKSSVESRFARFNAPFIHTSLECPKTRNYQRLKLKKKKFIER